MRHGIVMFCYDSQLLYSVMCNFNIQQIERHLGMPVTVYTDIATARRIKGADSVIITDTPSGNRRFFRGINQLVDWHNLNRSMVLLDPPYDRTVVIDTDYIVYSSLIEDIIKTDYEFLCYVDSVDATGLGHIGNDTVGEFSIPFCWATLMLITKSQTCRNIGTMMTHIRNNYNYFRRLYRIGHTNFRNDYALSIALHQLSGMMPHPYKIPGRITALTDDVETILATDSVNFCYEKNGETYSGQLENVDVHVMNKEAVYA